jgi:hypothetical protein
MVDGVAVINGGELVFLERVMGVFLLSFFNTLFFLLVRISLCTKFLSRNKTFYLSSSSKNFLPPLLVFPLDFFAPFFFSLPLTHLLYYSI